MIIIIIIINIVIIHSNDLCVNTNLSITYCETNLVVLYSYLIRACVNFNIYSLKGTQVVCLLSVTMDINEQCTKKLLLPIFLVLSCHGNLWRHQPLCCALHWYHWKETPWTAFRRTSKKNQLDPRA